MGGAVIDLALQEDIGHGDITTANLISGSAGGSGIIVAKEDVVLAGLAVAQAVFKRLDPGVGFESPFQDGDRVDNGETVASLSGSLAALLTGERTALNFLQRLSGIATGVRAVVAQLPKSGVRIVDTRKTTPGLRVFEKYAVRVGGAHNHRMGLYDGVLIKDNHIAACGGIDKAVAAVRKQISHLVKIEVEVGDLKQVQQALDAGVEIIMLDNMGPEQIREAVAAIRGRALVEVSGGVTPENIGRLVQTGVDLISMGALTHSARSVDLSMYIEGSGRREGI